MAGLAPVIDGAAAALDSLFHHFLAEIGAVLVDLRRHVLADIDRAWMNALNDVVVEAEEIACRREADMREDLEGLGLCGLMRHFT